MAENPFLVPFNPEFINERTQEKILRATIGLEYRANGESIGGSPGIHVGDGVVVIGPGLNFFKDEELFDKSFQVVVANQDKSYFGHTFVFYEEYGLSVIKLADYDKDFPFVPYDPEPNLTIGETLWVTNSSLEAKMSISTGRFMGMFREYFDDEYLTDDRGNNLPILSGDVFILQESADSRPSQSRQNDKNISAGVFNSLGKFVGMVSASSGVVPYEQSTRKGIAIPPQTRVEFVTKSNLITEMKSRFS